jgi:hypothetical protein
VPPHVSDWPQVAAVQVGVQQPASGSAQAPHWQSLPQVWLPQPPQACWAAGVQAPASPQAP